MINRIITEQEALKRLSSLCAKSEHSSGEANEKMIRWGLSPQSRSKVIAKLIDAQFIDDSLSAVHRIYGADFARIKSLDMFAEAVGTMLQNRIER